MKTAAYCVIWQVILVQYVRLMFHFAYIFWYNKTDEALSQTAIVGLAQTHRHVLIMLGWMSLIL